MDCLPLFFSMSYFVDPTEAVPKGVANFGTINTSTINIFPCSDGSLAGFRIINVGTDEDPYYVSQIYDSTTGQNVLLGTSCVQPGFDLAGGLFVTGCFSDIDPLDPEANFYLVDYT